MIVGICSSNYYYLIIATCNLGLDSRPGELDKVALSVCERLQNQGL